MILGDHAKPPRILSIDDYYITEEFIKKESAEEQRNAKITLPSAPRNKVQMLVLLIPSITEPIWTYYFEPVLNLRRIIYISRRQISFQFYMRSVFFIQMQFLLID